MRDLSLNRFFKFLLAAINLCLLTYGIILVVSMLNSFFSGNVIQREIKILVMLLALGVYLNIFLRKKRFWPVQELGLLSGFFLGFLPVILFHLTGQAGRYPGFGFAIVPLSRLLKNLSLLYQACLPEILGTRFGYQSDFLLHYFSYYIVSIYVCGVIYLIYQNRQNILNLFKLQPCKNDARFFLLTVLLVTPIIFIASIYPIDRHSFRYLLALYVVLPFLVGNFAYLIRKISRIAFYVFLSSMLFFFAYTHLSLYDNLEESNYYNQLITFLNEKEVTRAYANYWISYPVTFISEESIIVAPYKSRDRYPRYTEILREETTPSYIFYLYDRKMGQLEKSGELDSPSAYNKEEVGPYIVYYVPKNID